MTARTFPVKAADSTAVLVARSLAESAELGRSPAEAARDAAGAAGVSTEAVLQLLQDGPFRELAEHEQRRLMALGMLAPPLAKQLQQQLLRILRDAAGRGELDVGDAERLLSKVGRIIEHADGMALKERESGPNLPILHISIGTASFCVTPHGASNASDDGSADVIDAADAVEVEPVSEPDPASSASNAGWLGTLASLEAMAATNNEGQ